MYSLRPFGRSLSKTKPIKHLYLRYYSSAAKPKEKSKSGHKVRGSNSYVINLFSGHARPDQVFPYPYSLTDEEEETLSMMIEPIKKLYSINDPDKNDLEEKIPEDVFNKLKEIGALGLMVPVEYGGIGLNATQYARLGELAGGNDLGLSIFFGAHQSIGYKGVLLYGTDEQKNKYLPDLASGKKIAGYCLTEPSSGSDASSIQSKAELSPDGKHYILNGSKIWISNGGIADFFTVFAHTPSINPNETDKHKTLSAFLVERTMGGVTSGPPEKKMGIKCSNTAEVFFEDVKIPVENVLGNPGEGFKISMNILNSGRFGMSAALSGTMRELVAKATDFATNRTQFGHKISTYETTQEKISRMNIAHYITESLAYMVSGNMDRGHSDFQLEAAISKIFASEAAWYVCDETLQILGGSGYMRATGVERVLRDIRIFRIFEGTNDILRLFIALTGLQYAGSQLKELQSAIRHPVSNFSTVFDEGTRRIFRVVGLDSTHLSDHVCSSLKVSAHNVAKCIELFGTTVEHMLIRHGKNVIHEQFLLNRLANSVIDIYAMTTVLSRATNAFERRFVSAEHEADMVNIICSEGKTRVMSQLGMVRNHDSLKNFNAMKRISERIYEHRGIPQTHPIDGASK